MKTNEMGISMSKRYFWLKLKNDFFEQKEIKMLRRLAGGDTYTIIYLKMLLLSLKNDGKIYYDGIADSMIEEIALDIDEDAENVQVAFNYLTQKGMIAFSDEEELDMMNITEMIGSESASARRVRKHRNQKSLQSNTDVTNKKRLSNTEIEIEKELEIEIDKDKPSSDDDLFDRFEHLWKLYPNKKGKQNAFKAYKKAVKDNVSDEEIEQGILAYKEEIELKRTEPRFIKHGGTFFNQRSWEDDYETLQTHEIAEEYNLSWE